MRGVDEIIDFLHYVGECIRKNSTLVVVRR
jgi:hypothetical protein